jgi:hypothetical protein
MHLKRYRTPNVQEALELTGGELGPQALCLVAAHSTPGWRGTRQIEGTAAADPPVSEVRTSRQQFRQTTQDAADQAIVALPVSCSSTGLRVQGDEESAARPLPAACVLGEGAQEARAAI